MKVLEWTDWVFLSVALIFVIALAAFADTPTDACEFYICPRGQVLYPDSGGVVFLDDKKEDCVLEKKGLRSEAEEFIAKHPGKYRVIDCKKGKGK